MVGHLDWLEKKDLICSHFCQVVEGFWIFGGFSKEGCSCGCSKARGLPVSLSELLALGGCFD